MAPIGIVLTHQVRIKSQLSFLTLISSLTIYLSLLPLTSSFQVMYKSSSVISLNEDRKSPEMSKSLPKKFPKT